MNLKKKKKKKKKDNPNLKKNFFGVGGRSVGGCRVSKFYRESKTKKIRGGAGGRGLELVIFFYLESKSKIFFFFFFLGGGGGVDRGGWHSHFLV